MLRGEAVIKYTDFEEINSKIEDVEAKYKNPRNLCAGSVRQLSNEITAEMADHVVDGINYIQVHPTFLYESIGNLVILLLMLLYRKKS